MHFFPWKYFFWFFDIILLSKRLILLSFRFGRSILTILCRTYVRPDLHRIGHLDRRVKNIYFKAWTLVTLLFYFIVHFKQQTLLLTDLFEGSQQVPMELPTTLEVYGLPYKVLKTRRWLSKMGILKYHYHLMEYYKTLLVILSNTLGGVMLQ